MARKTHKPLTIALTPEQLLAQDRHTDWVLAQERGATRNGRSYIAGGAHGSDRTKAGRSRKACRGRVDY